MTNPFEIKVWAQMFFIDGSVSQGVRIPSIVYDDDREIDKVAEQLLDSANRTEGYLLIWGAQFMKSVNFPRKTAISCPLEELNS